MGWIVAPNIASLFRDVNRVAPDRDKSSDGTIGDYAHTQHPSSHNPDDTAGSLAEYSDADSIAEVRAGDIDSDLKAFSAQALVDAILASSADRARLKYLIYNGHIWSKSNGWARQVYSGTDPHTNHIHASGDPASDDNSSPWTSVLQLGDDMTFSDTDAARLANVERMLGKVLRGSLSADPGGNPENALLWWVRSLANSADPALAEYFPGWKAIPAGLLQLAQRQDAMVAEVAALRAAIGGLTTGSTDTAAILAGVDRAVAGAVAALTAETRDAVADLAEGGAAQVRADQGA